MSTLSQTIPLFLALAAIACAPFQHPASIYGIVQDTIGVPIKNARVVAAGVETATLTDSLGRYRLDSLLPGPTTVRAVMIGYFAEQRESGVRVGHTTRVDFVLRSPHCDADCAPVTVPAAPLGAEAPDSGR